MAMSPAPGPAPAEESLRSAGPWAGLVEDLRSAPPGALNAPDLARKHGLPPEFVEDVVLGSAHGPQERDFWGHLARLVFAVITEAAKGIRALWKGLIANPPLLLTGTTLILAILFHAAFFQAGFYRSVPPQRLGFGFRGLPAAFFFLALGSHLGAVYSWRSYPRAIWGSLSLFLVLLAGCFWVSGASPSGRPTYLAFLLAISAISLFHLFTGLVCAFLGSWFRLRREARDEGKLTRQEMLARLYELDTVLKKAEESGRPLARRKSFKEWARSSSVFPLWGVLYGLGFGAFEVLAVSGMWSLVPREDSMAVIPLQGLFNIAALMLAWVLGYYAGGAWRGAMAAVIASGGRLLPTLLPLGPYGLGFLRAESQNELLYFLLLAGALTGAFGGAAGVVDGRMAKGRRLRNNDPASLVAEMVRLERRLRGGSQGACVMAVDVARSTMIKADADPLAIEFSFRSYQDLVAQISGEFGGKVFSTAGDGALASFSSASDALLAAKALQSRIYWFNEQVNRLGHPFRLRIGLHAGKTLAEFSAAPFNELIDVAAHVEAVSPVGGIACTEAFRLQTPQEPMAEIAARVDGHRVWIVLSPILTE